MVKLSLGQARSDVILMFKQAKMAMDALEGALKRYLELEQEATGEKED